MQMSKTKNEHNMIHKKRMQLGDETNQHAKDRSAWRALVSVSVTSDPQS